MHAGVRTPVTIATAVLGAGMIAAIPMAAHPPIVQAPSIRLVDSSGAWLDAFDTASTNATQMFDSLSDSGSALYQSIGQLGDLSSIGASLENAFNAATFADVDVATPSGTDLAAQTLDFNHLWALQYISGMDMGDYMGAPVQIPEIQPAADILTLLSSPLSGVMIGMVGPIVSPAVALINSLEAITTDLGTSDLTGATQGLLDLPANVFDAFFNGATLNLDSLAPALTELLQVPAGNEVTGIEFAFGGLFTPGVTEAGNVGGSLFNSLGLDLIMQGMGMPYDAPGEAIGPIGALADLTQMIADALGASGAAAGASLADAALASF